MKRLRPFVLLLALVPALASGAGEARPEEVGLSSERLSRIKAYALAEVEKGRIAGAVSLVARRGHIVHLSAVGKADIEEGRELREDSIFRIASMTKPIVSLAVMMLHEEGRFLLDDPNSKFIPELGYNIASDPIDVRDLHATVLHLMGLDHTKRTHRFQGRDFRLTDVSGNVVTKLPEPRDLFSTLTGGQSI
jgi:CubicO group peptidase (beta-lactamase class C family)